MRAVARGVLDYAEFDPRDVRCWRRHRWLLDELEDQQSLELELLQHRHWTAFAAMEKLSPDSIDLVKTNATTALNKAMKLMFPWLADKIGEAGTKTEREEVVKQYHEIHGQPGEPRYEAMLQELAKDLKPVSQAEKLRRRRKRRAERERRYLAEQPI